MTSASTRTFLSSFTSDLLEDCHFLLQRGNHALVASELVCWPAERNSHLLRY